MPLDNYKHRLIGMSMDAQRESGSIEDTFTLLSVSLLRIAASFEEGEDGLREMLGRILYKGLPLPEINPEPEETPPLPPSKNYPMYFRDNTDCLIKAGWSRYKRGEYKHVIRKTWIDIILGELLTLPAPVKNTVLVGKLRGRVPIYAIYDGMTWLKTSDILVKKGHQGYWPNEHDCYTLLEEAWNHLPHGPYPQSNGDRLP